MVKNVPNWVNFNKFEFYVLSLIAKEDSQWEIYCPYNGVTRVDKLGPTDNVWGETYALHNRRDYKAYTCFKNEAKRLYPNKVK